MLKRMTTLSDTTVEKLYELVKLIYSNPGSLEDWMNMEIGEIEEIIKGDLESVGYDGDDNYDSIYWFLKGRKLGKPEFKKFEIPKIKTLGGSVEEVSKILRPLPPKEIKPFQRYDESEEYKRRKQKWEDDRLFRSLKDLKKPYYDTFDISNDRQNEEVMKFVNKRYRDVSIDCRDGVIMVQEPEDANKFETLLGRIKGRYDETEVVQDEKDPVTSYFLNRIKGINDVLSYVEQIYEKELKPFKICISFGAVVENQIVENGDIVSFEYIDQRARDLDVRRHAPTVVRDQSTKELFKAYLQSVITNTIQNATIISTKHRLICLYAVMFKVYRIIKIGAYLPGFEDLIKSKMIRVPTNDDNFCWDHVAVMFKYPKLRSKDIYSKGRSLAFQRVTGITKFNPKDKRYREFISEYEGFDLTTGINEYCNFYKVNVNIYECNKEHTYYYLTQEIKVNDKYELMSVLLVGLHGRAHAMLIKPDKVAVLTKFLFCPTCQQLIGKYSSKHGNKSFEKHVSVCDGSPLKKKCRLDLISQPYVPHIMKNNLYRYCLAKNIEYVPVRYYITFDFETMEQKLNEKISDCTTVNSRLIPLSVASTIKSKSGIKTIYYDVRDGKDFIHKWLLSLFDEAYSMREDNLIPGVPVELQTEQGINKSQESFPTYVITVLGFNSARFDLNILFSELRSDSWIIKSFLGNTNSFKQVMIQRTMYKCNIVLRFIDAKALSGPGTLRDFVKSFGSEGCDEKGVFPYEAFDETNYNEVLSKTEPFEQKDFYSYLNQSEMSDKEYMLYLEDAKNFQTRWDYLRHYNELDVRAMISPIDNIIEFNWEYKVDALINLSLSANASSIKYALAYKDFDPHNDYSTNNTCEIFKITPEFWKKKCEGYMKQDLKAQRDVTDILTVDDYEDMMKVYEECGYKCYLCHERFTDNNKPTLDRIDNKRCHSKDNVLFCCQSCNIYKSNRDMDEVRLLIQLRKYCLKNNLPMTIPHEPVYHVLRNGITGGLSNVLHRVNEKGKTHINHLFYDKNKKTVISEDNDYVMTHVCGTDFNSLYPSSFSSVENPNIPYTGGRLYMPGRLLKYYEVIPGLNDNEAYDLIMSDDRFTTKGQLFIAEIKGHIDEDYINEFINFPPIFRNIDIKTDEQTIGSYMYNYMKSNELSVDNKERKLTQLLKIDEYTAFSSYYLWFLIDRCHFIIDSIKSIQLYTKHMGFHNFVTTFMNERINAMKSHNKGKEQFCKTSLNGSYGYDGKNTEKYTKSVMKNRDQTFMAQLYPSFVSSRKLDNDCFMVTYNPKSFRCDTCLQEAFFTLDNAKYWYLNFIYNFMYRCLDMERIHYIEGDTDSAYWAIAGDPNNDYHQRFDHVIKDEEYYNEHVYEYFPDPNKDIFDEKKLLGLAIEKEGENCIALAPKCYTIWNNDNTTKSLKLKGVSLKKNKIVYPDYEKSLTKPVSGININLQMNKNMMSKITIVKNALTASHTKMVVLPNQSCCPYGFTNYVVSTR